MISLKAMRIIRQLASSYVKRKSNLQQSMLSETFVNRWEFLNTKESPPNLFQNVFNNRFLPFRKSKLSYLILLQISPKNASRKKESSHEHRCNSYKSNGHPNQ